MFAQFFHKSSAFKWIWQRLTLTFMGCDGNIVRCCCVKSESSIFCHSTVKISLWLRRNQIICRFKEFSSTFQSLLHLPFLNLTFFSFSSPPLFCLLFCSSPSLCLLCSFVYETEHFNGVAELLEILGRYVEASDRHTQTFTFCEKQLKLNRPGFVQLLWYKEVLACYS